MDPGVIDRRQEFIYALRDIRFAWRAQIGSTRGCRKSILDP
jgi:hypothetical protein